MGFTMPSFNQLTSEMNKLDEDYIEIQNTTSVHSFFKKAHSGYEDIYFIQNVSKDVIDKRFEYHELDEKFKTNDYSSKTAPFLKQAITGAAILVLTQINTTCSNESLVKQNNALAARIMKIYNIDKLSDIPKNTQLECFDALKQYLTIRAQRTNWHAEKGNDFLMKELNTAIEAVTPKIDMFATSTLNT